MSLEKMTPVFTVTEDQGIARINEPFTIGLPLPRGQFYPSHSLGLFLQNGTQITADIQGTAFWNDGSLRWCLVDTCLSTQAKETLNFYLAERDKSNDESEQNAEAKANTRPSIDTGMVKAEFNDDGSIEIQRHSHDPILISPPILTTAGNSSSVKLKKTEIVDGSSGQVKYNVMQEFSVIGAGDKLLLCNCHWYLYKNSTLVRCDITLHNPNPALHPNGHWDLGDPGSFLFKSLAFNLSLPRSNSNAFQLYNKDEWISSQNITTITQQASGGENWKSRTHVNANGDITLSDRGFTCQNGDTLKEGLRCQPIVYHTSGCSVSIDKFWQNFPSGLSISENKVTVFLFPAQADQNHEMQGGEKKTHTLYFDFCHKHDSLEWTRHPLKGILSKSLLLESECLPLFSTESSALDNLIAIGKSPDVGFLAKREFIDEYGWRNFGDIFADHENLYLSGNDVFVSHYNNQYDPIYGLLRQYLHHGDPEWFDFANDLAKHVCDIDIYHTEKDRAEYNGGLFWHTDHYVDAGTSTHRTYSRHQKPDGVNPTGGGGPGGQHCYTQGLTLHYFLTGNCASRDAVYSLAAWITHVYEGSGTFTETAISIKSNILPKLKKPGPKGGYLNNKLPLDRGVGNYINALLDCYLLSSDENYLTRVESIIRRTIHPRDPIEQHHLDDVETTWFYTVFLQAVIRYLLIVVQFNQERGSQWQYALQSTMHYAHWMLHNEKEYLSNKDILDYPNATWVAQEIRKAQILYFASAQASATEKKQAYRKKADFFYNYVCEYLSSSEEAHFSRILAILMQNHGSNNYANVPKFKINQALKFTSPCASRLTLAVSAIGEIINALLRFSLKRELKWLGFRSEKLKSIYLKLYGSD